MIHEQANRSYDSAQDRMQFLPNYYKWVYRRILGSVSGEVVELGCGAGLGIETYLDQVDHVHAVDFNDVLLERVRDRYRPERVSVISQDLRSEWVGLADVKADVVLMMDMLEHFEDDQAILRKASAIVRPGGLVILKVPAQPRMFSEMDRASGHYRRYDSDQIRQLCLLTGLELKSASYMNKIGALIYMRRRGRASNFSRTFRPSQLKLANRLMTLFMLFDAIPFVKGLSLIVIAWKPPGRSGN